MNVMTRKHILQSLGTMGISVAEKESGKVKIFSKVKTWIPIKFFFFFFSAPGHGFY